MTNTLIAAAYFLVALLTGHIQLEYLRARDLRLPMRGALLDGANYYLQVIPFALFFFQLNWQVILVEGIAQSLASYHGIKKLPKLRRRRKKKAKKV